MEINDTIDKLLCIPRRFKSLGNVSIYNLLRETGYFEIRSQITVESIREAITRTPKYVDDWLAYSDDKRCSPSWFFKKKTAKRYVVGYLSGDETSNTQIEYDDRLTACAAFIKHEIDALVWK